MGRMRRVVRRDGCVISPIFDSNFMRMASGVFAS